MKQPPEPSVRPPDFQVPLERVVHRLGERIAQLEVQNTTLHLALEDAHGELVHLRAAVDEIRARALPDIPAG